MKQNSRFEKKLYTTWGRNIDKNNVLTEYPRPLLKRDADSYVNLNGIWKYAFTASNKRPVRFDGDILVQVLESLCPSYQVNLSNT